MANKVGRIRQVTGAVVDVQFDDELPAILNALETKNHAVDRALDERGIIRLVHVVGADPFKDIAKKIELSVELGVRRGRRKRSRNVQKRCGGRKAGHEQERPEREFRLAHHPCTF